MRRTRVSLDFIARRQVERQRRDAPVCAPPNHIFIVLTGGNSAEGISYHLAEDSEIEWKIMANGLSAEPRHTGRGTFYIEGYAECETCGLVVRLGKPDGRDSRY